MLQSTLLRWKAAARFALSASFASLILLAAGCATTQRVALTPPARANLGAVTTAVSLEQPEIGADINESNITAATGGGLLFAIIDAGINTSRAKKAEKAASEIRKALMDYDATVAVRGALEAQKENLALASMTTESWAPAVNSKVIETKLKKAKGDAVLLISIDQRLSPDFSKIQINARIALFPVKAELKAGAEETAGWPAAIYNNRFITDRSLPDFPSGSSREEASALWVADNAAAARAALDACFDELAKMIAYDLPLGTEANLAAKEGEKVQAPLVQNGRLVGHGRINVKGSVARKNDDQRKWVRFLWVN